MGLVYTARDPLLKRDVAIKVLAPEFRDDDGARERFLREAPAAAAVAHPNVVGIFQVGELRTTRIPYFIMQFVEGTTVEQAYPRGTAVPEPVARRIISEIAAALGAAHARGLVHRDIKPSNVMLDPHTGRAIVLDFGISASVRQQPRDEKLTGTGVYLGTPRYMSPEQASGEGITDKSDMYGLGCVAYELLAGRPVFEGKNVLELFASHLRDTPRPLTEVRPGLDRELGALVMRCLEKDPEKRPAAAEMAQRLTPGGGVLLEWPPPGLETMHRKLGPMNRLLWAGTLLLLVTGLSLILAGAALPSVLDSAAIATLLVAGAVGVFMLLEATRRAIGLGRAATASVRSGYGWLTVAETIADPDGETGGLITGSRRFAALTTAQRSELRRGRLVRAAAMFLGGLAPIPAIALVLLLASFRPFDPTYALIVLLLSAAGALVAAHAVARERTLAPPLRAVRQHAEPLDAARLAPAWYETFERARTGQPLGPGSRRRSRMGVGGGALVAAVAALVVAVLAPLAVLATAGSAIFEQTLPRFANTSEKSRLAEIVRPFTLPRDSRISPLEAGRAFYALSPPRAQSGPFRMQPYPPRPPRPWTGHPPAPGLFTTARPDSWDGPASTKILEAVGRGFSADELAWLQAIATAPVWRDWAAVARAPAGDILGASLVLPFARNVTHMEIPIARYAAIKEVAYASLSRAAWHMARKQNDSAEVTLRETISAGFFLADNATFLIDQLIGVVIVGIGRDGLTRFYTITGNPAGPRLKARHDSAMAAREARQESVELDSAGGAAPIRNAPAARRRVLALATSPLVHRALRLEMLIVLGMAPCTNVREMVFGPDKEIRDAFAKARKELARYPADSAALDLIAESTERGFPRSEWDLRSRLVLGAASTIGAVLHNRRIRGCTELLLQGGPG
jgi:hypothetical protein